MFNSYADPHFPLKDPSVRMAALAIQSATQQLLSGRSFHNVGHFVFGSVHFRLLVFFFCHL